MKSVNHKSKTIVPGLSGIIGVVKVPRSFNEKKERAAYYEYLRKKHG